VNAIVRLTLRRLVRGKALWLALGFAALPPVLAAALPSNAVGYAFEIEMLLYAVIPPLVVAGAIGEDLEERTATYLWSRPVARWTIVVGKLVALAPVVAAIDLASWAIAGALAGHGQPSLDALVAVAAGALAVSTLCAGIAALVPRHAMAVTIVYMLFDDMIGQIPARLQLFSVTHHAGRIVGIGEPVDATSIALVAIPAVWLALGLRRVRRLEV